MNTKRFAVIHKPSGFYLNSQGRFRNGAPKLYQYISGVNSACRQAIDGTYVDGQSTQINSSDLEIIEFQLTQTSVKSFSEVIKEEPQAEEEAAAPMPELVSA